MRAPDAARPSRFGDELRRCAKARRENNYALALQTARQILRVESQHAVAWAYLCWALFNMKRYDEAKRQCWRALSKRSWSLRDREGMNALVARCDLLQALSRAATSSVGDSLRSGWYTAQLTGVLQSSTELDTDEGAGTVVLGDQSNADVALLLDLQAEQGVPRCQVFDTSRRFGMGGHVLERRAALGGPSKQLGGAFEGVEDGEHFDARVVL